MLRITHGADEYIGIQFPTGTDLTGCTVLFTVKKPEDLNTVDNTDSNAVVKATESAHTRTGADPVNGKTVLKLPHSETGGTAAIPGEYVYDIWLIDTAGDRHPYVKKPRPITIEPSATQRPS